MKIYRNNFNRENGSAALTFTILLAIMMILFVVNSQSLIHVHREIRLLDQQQIKRLNSVPANSVTVTNSVFK